MVSYSIAGANQVMSLIFGPASSTGSRTVQIVLIRGTAFT